MRTKLVSGNLRAFPIANILQLLSASRVTGVLSMASQGRRAYVRLQDGQVIGASKNKTPRLHQRVASTPEQEEALMTRVCDVVASVLNWPEGQFAFLGIEGQEPPVELRLDVERVLMLATWTLDEQARAS